MIKGAIEGLFSIPTDTAPSIKDGPEVLEKQMLLSASILDIFLFFLKLDTIFAPTGYPDTILIEKEKAPVPGALKRDFIIGSKKLPINSTKPIPINNSETIKKGNKEGIIILNQVIRPSAALFKDNFGLIIMPIKSQSINNKKKRRKRVFFIGGLPPY